MIVTLLNFFGVLEGGKMKEKKKREKYWDIILNRSTYRASNTPGRNGYKSGNIVRGITMVIRPYTEDSLSRSYFDNLLSQKICRIKQLNQSIRYQNGLLTEKWKNPALRTHCKYVTSDSNQRILLNQYNNNFLSTIDL